MVKVVETSHYGQNQNVEGSERVHRFHKAGHTCLRQEGPVCLELSLCRPGAQAPSQEEDLCDTLTGEHAGSGSRAASTQ